MSAANFLRTIYGQGDGWVHLSTTKQLVAVAKCSEVAELADKMSGRRDVYLSAAVIGTDKGSGTGGRIEDADAAQLTSLWTDLDRAGEPGHKTEAALWTRDDIGQLLEALPIKPTAIVDSGGGWWFFFTLTEPVPLGEDGRGELLLARWARYWHGLADERGRHMDGVFNAGRIVRAPGSINGKEEGRIAVVKSLYPERTYTADQLDAILPAPEPPAASYPASSDGDRPGDQYNREATVASMVALLEGRGFHSARNVGGRIDLTRLGKNHRDGHSVTVWADATVTFWSSAPEGLPGGITLRDRNGASGTYDPFGVYAHVEHGGDFVAAARARNPVSRVQVGGHTDKGKELPPGEGRRLQLTRVSEIDPLPVRWLWHDRIPIGEITLTPGLAGVGKSTFHAWLIAQITRGSLPGVYEGAPRPVIVCAREDSWERSIVPRLIAAGADRDLVYRADVVTDHDHKLQLTLPADTGALHNEIERLGVALVSLDPLLSNIDKRIDTYKSREVRDALEPLQALADETRCVILGNAHFNKATGSDPLLRITGAAAFGEVCRAALAFAHDADSATYVISQAKNNLGRLNLPNLTYRLEPFTVDTKEGPSEVSRLVFTGETLRGVREILNPHVDPDRGEKDIARDLILDVLATGPESWEAITKVIKREGISERTGQRGRDELRKAGLIDKSGGGGQPWKWHRVLSHSGESGQHGQHGQHAWPTKGEVSQPLANGKPNGDAYLANLANIYKDTTRGPTGEDVGQLAPNELEEMAAATEILAEEFGAVEVDGLPDPW